jgi:hypothetical protein
MPGWVTALLALRELHVLPLDDLLEHELDEDCFCGPDFLPVDQDDGSIHWLYQHHSADGREHSEPDHDPRNCPLCSSRA